MRKILAITAMVVFGATGVSAKTITLEATMDNLYGSTALLSDLGLTSGGSVKALITFDNDLADGATTVSYSAFDGDYLYSPYDSFVLNAPSGTITAPSSDGSRNTIFTRDTVSMTSSLNDVFQAYSFPNSNDPSSFRQMYIQSLDQDNTKWDRSTPITADLLNSFSNDFFYFIRNREDGYSSHNIYSSSITWNEVDIAPVPLPASLPLFLIGLTGLGLVARRRRNNHI